MLQPSAVGSLRAVRWPGCACATCLTGWWPESGQESWLWPLRGCAKWASLNFLGAVPRRAVGGTHLCDSTCGRQVQAGRTGATPVISGRQTQHPELGRCWGWEWGG